MNYTELQNKYDKSNLFGDLSKFSEQFDIATKYVEDNKIEGGKVKNVIICGMGGSSLPADIINDIQSQTYIHTCRNYDLPDWVDQDTLVIASSYSGNTEEVLSAIEQAKDITKNIVVITAGGKLMKVAEKQNYQKLILPTGFQPRIATGHILTYLLHTLAEYNLIEKFDNDLKKVEKVLKTEEYKQKAQQIVDLIEDKLPIIYSTVEYSSIARINKIKINENGKTQAFWYVFPELNHNEMAGLKNMRIDPVFIIFKGRHSNPKNIQRAEIFEKILSEVGSFINIETKGESKLEEIMYSLLLGDWISYYMALKSETNPTPVKVVEDFKKMLK